MPVPRMKEFLSKGQGFAPGDHLTEVAVGRHMLNYDSMLVYTHFKGHAMGGLVILGQNTRLYVSGDGGYGSQFEKIGKKYGPFDMTLIDGG